MTRVVIAALLLAASAAALSQTLYRWTDEQGKTHYGDRPPKGAIGLVRVDTGPENTNTVVPAPAPPVPPVIRKPAPVAEAPKEGVADRATQRRTTRERLQAELNRARDNLEAAKKKLADGGDMQDDERQTVQQRGGRPPVTAQARQNCRTETGSDGKTSLMCPVTVPNDQYYDRMAKLEDAVKRAEEEVAAAEAAYRRGVD